MQKSTDLQRLFEIAAVITTGFCKFIFVDIFPLKLWYILVTCIFWITYVFLRCRTDHSVLQYWGFTTAGLRRSFLQVLPFAVGSLIVFLVYGITQDTLVFNWHIILILLLYPVWGVIQQFLIVALIAGNLNDLKGSRLSRTAIVIVTAVVFSSVHYPSMFLIGATFILALVYTPIYLSSKNLWVLGIYHGWLACLFYFFVLGRDPWAELMKTI